MKDLIIRKGAELKLNVQDASPHQFASKIRHGGSDFLGAPDANVDLSRATRRQIMQALRKSCETLGVGQKSRIGRLGGGVAVSAIILGITGPATAQYAAGGGVANDTQSTAVGSGTVAGQPGVQQIDLNGDTIPDVTLNQDTAVGSSSSATGGFATAIGNALTAAGIYSTAIGSGSTATGDQAVAIGRSNTVNSFNNTSTITNNGVFDRAIGGNFTLPTGNVQEAS